MGILDTVAGGFGELTGANANTFVGKFLSNKTKNVDPLKPDFENFTITEYVDGVPNEKTKIILQGNMMPLIPFEFGGEQNLVSEHYAGNPEPTVQVLGAKEDEVPIKGRFKASKFKGEEFKTIALQFQMAVDEMRKRGNIVKIQLGTWRRYGFIKKATFKLNRITDIEYDINFFIIGENYPSGKVIASQDESPATANLELLAKANEAMDKMKAYPESMPRSIADNLNDIISAVAGVVSKVNSIVNSLVTEAENIKAVATRAEGVVKNARNDVSSYKRRVAGMSPQIQEEMRQKYGVSKGLTETVKNKNHLNQVGSSLLTLQAQLAALQMIVSKYANAAPLRTHLVKDGDTLQKISMLYYRTADNWQKIMSHNNLSSTELRSGQRLEIPK